MVAPIGDKLELTDRMIAFLNYYFADPLKVFRKTKESAERLKADALGHPPKCKGFFLNAGVFFDTDLFVSLKVLFNSFPS